MAVMRSARACGRGSIEPLKIHSRVQGGDLLGVPVEYQRGSSAKLPNPALRGLAEVRMVYLRIDVRVETIGTRKFLLPRADRLCAHERDFHNRLYSLEAVFPGHNQSQRSAVLAKERLVIDTHGDDRQGVHRLVETQALHVWPRQQRRKPLPLASHFLRPQHGREFRKPLVPVWFKALQQITERKPSPGNHHRPGFYTAHSIDTLL